MGWRPLAIRLIAALLCATAAAPCLAAPLPDNAVPGVGLAPADVSYVQALTPRGQFSIVDVAAGALDAHFQPPLGEGPLGFARGNELWVGLRVRNPAGQTQAVQLQVRQTSLDDVVLFEPQGTVWRTQVAGDRMANSQWTRPGRFARFDLSLAPLEARTVFLRVRNNVAAPLPMQLGTAIATELWTARADFGLAFALGALFILALASLIQAGIYRDRTYFIFGTYAVLLAFSLSSLSGVSDELLWGDYPDWSDAAKTVFPVGAAGMSVFLVIALCRVRVRSAALARTGALAGACVVAVALSFAAMRAVSPPLTAGAMVLAAVTVLYVAGWTWRRGDPMGAWVAAAHAPMMVTTAMIVLRMFGIEPLPFRANALVSVSAGFILILMLVALIRRSKELLAVRERAQGIESIDPLTGMLSAPLFHDRVRAAVDRFRRSRHDAAVIHVRMANFEWIRERHGLAVAEQSLIRAAMKLQRVFGEADCFGRVGEGTLGFIVETVTRRDVLQERSARLVALGLMPLPGLKPEVTLILHIAVAILSDHAPEAQQLQDALDLHLQTMTVRTRKPIRFLEAPVSGRTHPERELAGGEGARVGPEVGDQSVVERRA
jgi:GGDEF domain-containing protein